MNDWEEEYYDSLYEVNIPPSCDWITFPERINFPSKHGNFKTSDWLDTMNYIKTLPGKT